MKLHTKIIAVTLLAITGCAPMTPQQQQAIDAFVNQSFKDNKAMLEQQQQQIQNKQNRRINCSSYRIGNNVNTDCQ